MKRQPGSPPSLPNLSFIRTLRPGGHADVFLYEQIDVDREVAVKVLATEHLRSEVRQKFDAEAKMMAKLSHPYIVPVLWRGTADDGRPYIVMKYYPLDLDHSVRLGQFSVRDVLRVGIQIASAVETVHQAGILHRDIKPSNVLIDIDGKTPGLSDFGIAATIADTAPLDLLSVQWAPPEVVRGKQSDVYSLGATLWYLLEGRAPYSKHGDNSDHAVRRRVRDDQVPVLARSDVPDSLRNLLRQALAKVPEGRPPSAIAFATELRVIEERSGLAQTEIVVSGPRDTTDWLSDGDDVPTRERETSLLDLERDDTITRGHRECERDSENGGVPPEPDPPPVPEPRPPAPDRTRTVRVIQMVAAAVVVIALGMLGLARIAPGGTSAVAGPETTPSPTDQAIPVVPAADQPTVSIRRIDASRVRFSLKYENDLYGDRYRWEYSVEGAATKRDETDETWLDVPVGSGDRVCVTAEVGRAGSGTASPRSDEECSS